MTLLAGSISVLLALLMTFAGAFEAGRGAARSRAQIAADAAALAAVAESSPIGRGVHLFEARRFAEANGGELLSCLCYRGADAVQVEVEVAGERATARAAFEADLLMPSIDTVEGLNPLLARAVARLLSATDGAVHVVSGFRTSNEQARLWDEALDRYGNAEDADDWVAPPGHSMHESGLAVDLGGDLDLALRMIERLGLPLHRPLGNEPWHFELVGSRGPDAV
jgi:hypothetical protein